MRKKDINFKEQIQNSQKFLQKLQTIKKSSKQIKDKNKLTQHRNLWVKQYKYLARLQRDMDLQLVNYFDNFDKYFQFEIQDKQIFESSKHKNYSEFKSEIQQNFQQFQAQTLQQVQSLPILLQKFQKLKNRKQISHQQIIQILCDISKYLNKISLQTQQLQQQLSIQSLSLPQIQLDQQHQNLFSLKSLSSDIKGFDFAQEKIKKLKENQENLIHYLDFFKHKLGQDQVYQVMNQFHYANNLLEQTKQLENQKIHLDYEQALSLDNQLLQNSSNFHIVNHIYSTYIGRGKSVQLYFERLAIQFPKINRRHLDLITSYIQAKIYKQKKLKAVKRNYYREKQQLFAKVDREIHIRMQKKIQKAKKQAQILQRRQQRLKLQKQLEVLRADYNQRNQQKLNQKSKQQQIAKQNQRKKQALRKLYLDQLSKKAQQVIQIKTQKQKQQQKLISQKKLAQQQVVREKILLNKPKVQIRQSIQRKKIDKKLQQKQLKQKLPQIQAQRIKRAIQSYQFRPQIQFSQQRLNKPTQSLIKKRQTKMDLADKVQLSKITGFSVNQLMGDMRYKLNAALQEAGLTNTDYAREMLVAMSKRQQ